MFKQLALAVGFVVSGFSFSGCRVAAPVLEDAGGYSQADSCDTKTKKIVRQQGRNARKCEEFIDTYFWNYDIHDPYRGDKYVLDGDDCCR